MLFTAPRWSADLCCFPVFEVGGPALKYHWLTGCWLNEHVPIREADDKRISLVTRDRSLSGPRVVLLVHGGLTASHAVNTKDVCNICTMSDQRQRRWADVVQMLHKCFVGWQVLATLNSVCSIPTRRPGERASSLDLETIWRHDGSTGRPLTINGVWKHDERPRRLTTVQRQPCYGQGWQLISLFLKKNGRHRFRLPNLTMYTLHGSYKPRLIQGFSIN